MRAPSGLSLTLRDTARPELVDQPPRFALRRSAVASAKAEGRAGKRSLVVRQAHHERVKARWTRRIVSCLAWYALVGAPLAASAQPAATLKIGVTLHPYYSWTKNVVGDLPGYEVRSILPGEIDAGDYQPRPDDIKKLVDLDAIVVNGIGHDDFILPMIKASGNKKLVIIRPNETTPQIHAVARQQRQLAHVHLVHQRHPADLRDPEGARRAAAAGRRRAAAQRRRVRPAAAADQVEGGAAAGRSEDHARRHRARRLRLSAAGVRPRGRRRRAAGARPDAVGRRAARHGASCCSARRFASCSARRRFRPPMLKVLQDEGGREGLHHHAHRLRRVHRRQVRARDAAERRHDDPRAGHRGMTDGGEPTALLEIDGLTVRRHREALLDDVPLRVRRGSAPRHRRAQRRRQEHAALGAARARSRSTGGSSLNWTGTGTIGYVPQSFAVDPTLPVTVADFLALTRQRRPVCLGLDAPTRGAPSPALLDRVGLPGLEQRPLAVLSGGELRRVLLAHALDPEPELLHPRRADQRARRRGGRRWLDEILLAVESGRGRTTVADGVARSRAGAARRRPGDGARSARRRRGIAAISSPRRASASCCRPCGSGGSHAHDGLLRLDRRPGAARPPAERLPVSISHPRLPLRAGARADSRRPEPPGRHAAHGVLQRGARPGGDHRRGDRPAARRAAERAVRRHVRLLPARRRWRWSTSSGTRRCRPTR